MSEHSDQRMSNETNVNKLRKTTSQTSVSSGLTSYSIDTNTSRSQGPKHSIRHRNDVTSRSEPSYVMNTVTKSVHWNQNAGGNDVSDAGSLDTSQTIDTNTPVIQWRRILSVPSNSNDDPIVQDDSMRKIDDSNPHANVCLSCDNETRNLKLLPCLHSFCTRCLETQFNDNASRPWIKCLQCKKKADIPNEGVDGFEENCYFQFSELSVSENERCAKCRDRTPNCRCTDCSIYLCTDCVKDHLSQNTDKQHYIVNITQEMLGKAPWDAVCKEHAPFTLELFCLTCSEPICGRCAINKHNNHIADDLHANAAEKRADLKALMSDRATQRLLRGIDSHVTSGRKDRELLQDDINKTIEDIETHIQSLKDELDEFGKKIINDVKERESNLISSSDRKIKHAEDKHKSVSLTLEIMKQIVERTRDIEFLSKYPSVKEALLQLKKSGRSAPSQCVTMSYHPMLHTLKSSVGNIRVDVSLKRPIEFLETCTIQLFKHISSICPVDDMKAWVGFRRYIQLCSKDGTLGKRVDVGDMVTSIAENSNGTIFVACKTCMKVITGKLLPKLIFQLSHEPSDIMFNENDNLVLCFKDARRVAMFTSKGKPLKELDLRHLGFRLGARVNDPWKLAIHENQDIFVTDFTSDSVVVYDKEGEIKATFSSNAYKHSSIAYDRGLLYIADYKKDSVRLYSDDGKALQTCHLEGLNAPSAIAVDKTGDLWLGSWNGFVKVYATR